MNYIIFIATCAVVGVGNYYVYQYVGFWIYAAISVTCGLIWTTLDIRKKGF